MVSNKKFSKLRLEYLKNKHLPNISIDELNYHIEKIGDSSDRVNMSNGISIPSEEMYSRFLLEFGVKLSKPQLNEIGRNLDINYYDIFKFIIYYTE